MAEEPVGLEDGLVRVAVDLEVGVAESADPVGGHVCVGQVTMGLGVTWLPAYFWRINKTWRGVRAETPWLDRLPSEIVREHVRLTIQPFDEPDDAKQIATLIEEIGSDDMLLFSTDYPHWQFDETAVLPAGLSPSLIRKIMIDNPRDTYARLLEPVQ